jgi:predicted CXXCH cytochrome family protein
MKRTLVLLALVLFPALAQAGYQEDFEREFMSKAWYGEQVAANACIACHASETMKPEFRAAVDSWNTSWHAQNGISCEHCHGGDPRDAALSMTRERGFVGTPKPTAVPAFCGKCHLGIMTNFLESGHGRSLTGGKKAPNCVTCHGSHGTRKANIDIINEQLCTKCHSYDRARIMKQALFLTEKKFTDLGQLIGVLKSEGIYTDPEEKTLFSIQAEFRTLFHSVDVNLVKQRTDEFSGRLDQLGTHIDAMQRELKFRKNFSAFLMLAFSGMGFIVFLLSRMPDE